MLMYYVMLIYHVSDLGHRLAARGPYRTIYELRIITLYIYHTYTNIMLYIITLLIHY